MAKALHSRAEIAAFAGDGDPRLITAAYRDLARVGELYLLEDGTAAALREFTRTELRCPFPNCPRPELKAVARAKRRDGFSHLPGAHKHSPESINHLQGKAVVAAWLRRLYGDDAVEVEAASDTQRSRVADVMLTLDWGLRVALEVQYAPLTVAKWRERHESYAAQGIIDVWMWGHTTLRGLESRRDAVTFTPTDIHHELMGMGWPVLFIDPEHAHLGVAVNDWEGSETLAYESPAGLTIQPLREFNVDAGDLSSPWLEDCRAVGDARLEALRIEAVKRRVLHMEFAGLLAKRLEWKRRDDELKRQLRAIRAAEAAERRRKLLEEQEAESAHRRAAQPRLPVPLPDGPWTHCRVCGGALADVLRDTGFHVMCARRSTW